MVYSPKVNDYVTFGVENQYGKIKGIDVTSATATIVDSSAKEHKGIALGTIKLSRMARISIKAGPNLREVVENVVLMSAYNPLVGGRAIMGAENMSFLVAEIIHEFLTKGLAASFMDMLDSTTLSSADDKEAYFQTADFTDAARKIPFVFALTQLTQKFLFKKPLGHGMLHNLLGGYSAMVVSNFGDRMYYSDEPKYDYP